MRGTGDIQFLRVLYIIGYLLGLEANMKKMFFLLPVLVLMLVSVSCEKFLVESLVGDWGNSYAVYVFDSDNTFILPCRRH